eukprot:TRINITY_DN5316_c0_g3_i1.p1 TRINITY_DN5316_c0_g3~~TRINITY_DN5316_c0_g3_i1.p1  ORF type:complete len:122 (+),score=34.30 TRINITY_DN5316_c0_g3_i1:321-686(+)
MFIFETLSPSHIRFTRYFRGAQGVLICYDVSSRATFENVQRWMKEYKKMCEDCCAVLVGNKVDLDGSLRKVSVEEGKSLAGEFGCDFIETSVKMGENVEEAFKKLAIKAIEIKELSTVFKI